MKNSKQLYVWYSRDLDQLVILPSAAMPGFEDKPHVAQVQDEMGEALVEFTEALYFMGEL